MHSPIAHVATARGEVAADQLGLTLMHEHVFLLSPGLLINWPHVFDTEREVRRATDMLDAAYGAGVRTIVDLTTIDLGRDLHLLAEVARRTQMQIVVATGVHLNPPPYLRRRVPDRVVELFVHDIVHGIAESGIHAGVIKVASGSQVTEQNRVHLRAAARAHLETGAPISTHADAAAHTGQAQLAIFDEEGVDLSRVVIGHCGDSTDLAYLRGLMDAGATIGMDRFGTGIGADTDARVATIAELCASGYADRMVLSHDTSCYSDTLPWSVRQAKLPSWDFTMLSLEIIPRLRSAGVTEAQLLAMTAQNPARILAGRLPDNQPESAP